MVYPIGKLPVAHLDRLISQIEVDDPRVVVGPGIGLDCAVVDLGSTLLVFKSDPITFASEDVGWYLVQVNANDIATTGALPKWLLVTALLPDGVTTPAMVDSLLAQINSACQEIGVVLIGGHTEITSGLNRPILVGTMIGEVTHDQLVTPRGAEPGDLLLLTKGIPIEGTAIMAREFYKQISEKQDVKVTPQELANAKNYLQNPGISVLKDAQLALQAGEVHAMHDPTEGGLYASLWELAKASSSSFAVDLNDVYLSPISTRICQALEVDPYAAISSGALLLAVEQSDADRICASMSSENILCSIIGEVLEGDKPGIDHKFNYYQDSKGSSHLSNRLTDSLELRGEHLVWQKIDSGWQVLPFPARDEIARLFDRFGE